VGGAASTLDPTTQNRPETYPEQMPARRPLAALRSLPEDSVLAGALLVAAQLELLVVGPVPHEAVAVVAAFGLTVPFAWRRRQPLLVLVVVIGTFLTQAALGVPDNAQVIVPLVWALACFGAAAYSSSLPTALAAFAVVAVALAVLAALGILIPSLSDLLYAVAILTLVPWMIGRLYRARRAEAIRYAGRAARAEAESERRAQEVLELERRRIARELHDIIAHSLSLMVLQAGAASEVLTRSPDKARSALDTVQDTGRQALVEMKRLLAVLRAPDTASELGPQPGLADLTALVDHVRTAGVDVALDLPSQLHAPAGIELSAYRVVQEALTNVIKHAGAEHAAVTVRGHPRDLEVEVVDDGKGSAAARGDGHGLIGMRERVGLYGGELTAGAAADGFAVRARFPLDGSAGRPR
jgi:signal transduction histidine kinase